MTIGTRIIRAPRGTAVSCNGWLQHAATDNPDAAVAKIETRMNDRVARSIALNGDKPHGMSLAEVLAPHAQRPDEYIAIDIPGFVPEYVRPAFCEGKGPFRWAVLSGDPEDIHVTDAFALDMFSDDDALDHLAAGSVAAPYDKLERVLTCDPGIGVARHADVGDPEAIATVDSHGIRRPMRAL